ncbi:MAG: hypothetical protein WD794_11080 [Mycobacteriales bacterium]
MSRPAGGGCGTARRLLLLGLLLAAWLGPAAPASASLLCLPDCAPVVVVGVPGLRWSDVGAATPTLQRLAGESAVGALSVKAVPAVSCPADGWLTLGAGNRAEAVGVRRDPCGADLPGAGTQVAAGAAEREGTEPGALARALENSGGGPGRCVQTQGRGPALATGNRGGADAGRVEPCLVRLRAAPAVSGEGDGRAASARVADRAVAALVPEAATLLVVGLSEAPGDRTAGLHVALAHGPSFAPGALRSPSTRRAPYVQLVDVAPTVLELVGVPAPASMTGQPWRSAGPAPSPSALAGVALQAEVHKAVTVPFFVTLLAAQLVLILLALWRRWPHLAELIALGGVAALGASYLANLVPWWRSPAPLPTLLVVVVALAAAVVALSMATGGRRLLRPVGLVCGFTAAVLLLDLVTGAHLQMSSVAGYSPLVAGRFAGIGNVAFGVLAASVLLATAALTRRARTVAAVGVVTVAVDGAAPWGSDVGGVLALVPAFVLLAMLLAGRRVTLLRLALAGLAGVAVITAFALVDWSRRPAERTHLGRFVQDVAEGTAGTLLRRKAEAVLGLLFASPVTALLPLAVAAAVYLLVRPPAALEHVFRRAPGWRAGLLATGLAGAVGFAVNDSGAAVVALALAVAAPATAAVVLRARRAPEVPPSLLA